MPLSRECAQTLSRINAPAPRRSSAAAESETACGRSVHVSSWSARIADHRSFRYLCFRLLTALGVMICHTTMPKTKVALTLDSALLERVDELVDRRWFRNRSQAIEAALADKLQRLARTRLARESAKLNPREEKRLADEGLAEDLASWPEY